MTPAAKLKFQPAQAVLGSFSMRETLTAAQEHMHAAGASFGSTTHIFHCYTVMDILTAGSGADILLLAGLQLHK